MRYRLFWEKSFDPLAEIARVAEEHVDGEFSPEAQSVPVMMTPVGPFPITIAALNSRQMNFWTAHTNFDITEPAVARIEAVPGVESLDIFSRYRFRVGIARAFDDKLVKRAVREAAAGSLAWAAGEYFRLAGIRYWAVAKMPKKKLGAAVGRSKSEVMAKLEGGVLVCCSW